MSRIRKVFGWNLQQNPDQAVSLAQEARLRYFGNERLQVSYDTGPYKDIGLGAAGGGGTAYHLPRWDSTGKALEDSRVVDDNTAAAPDTYVRLAGAGLRVEMQGINALNFVSLGGARGMAFLDDTGTKGWWLTSTGTLQNNPTPSVGWFSLWQGVGASNWGTVIQARENFNTYFGGPLQIHSINQGDGSAPWPGQPDPNSTALYYLQDDGRTYLWDDSIPLVGETRGYRPIPRYEGHHVQAVVQEAGGLPAAATPRFTLYGSTYGGSTDSANFGWVRYGSDNNNFKIYATEGTFGSTSDTNIWVNYYASWLYGTWQARFQAAIGGTVSSQAGLIIRDPISFNGDTWYIYLGVQYQAQKVWFSYRQYAGDPATAINVDVPVNAPIWLRMVVSATQIEAYYSLDGNAWTLVGVKSWTIIFPMIYGWTIVPNAPAAQPPPEAYFEDFRFPGVTAQVAGPAIVTTYAQRTFLRFTGTGIQGIADDAANNATTVTVARGAGLTVLGEASGVAATRGFIRLRGANWTVTDDTANNQVILEVGGGTGADGGAGRQGYFPVYVGSPTGPLADVSHLSEDTANFAMAYNAPATAGHTLLLRPQGDNNGVVVWSNGATVGLPFAYYDVDGNGKFWVDHTGNIAYIKNVAYVWPDAHGVGALVSDINGNLAWAPAGSGSVGPGTVNTLAKFIGTPPAPSSVVSDSGITDDGALVTVNAESLVVKQSNATLVEAQLAFVTNELPAKAAIWRYETRPAGLADPTNNTDGQMALFINASDPCAWFGKGSSWIESALYVRPPAAWAGPAFETQKSDGAPAFSVASADGNLALLRGVTYSWPTAAPTLAGQVLTYDGLGNLKWQAPAGSGTVSGSLNYVAKFTPNGTTVGNSNITDDGAHIIATGDFRVHFPFFDLCDVFWETNTNHFAFWRYEHRGGASQADPDHNVNGEMQLWIDNLTTPSSFFGDASAWLRQSLNIVRLDAGLPPLRIYAPLADPNTATPTFKVDNDGNLAALRSVSYVWPLTGPTLNDQVLTYDLATTSLTWRKIALPANLSGRAGYFPVFGPPNNELVDISALQDNGSSINAYRALVVQSDAANDLSDIQWQATASRAIFRYEHRVAAARGYGDPANDAGGEMHLFLSDNVSRFFVGQKRSWFLMPLHVRPVAGTDPVGLEVDSDTTPPVPLFQVKNDGDLSIIKTVPYQWPGTPPAAGVKWLQYNPVTTALTWIDPPAAAVSIAGQGTALHLSKWTTTGLPAALADSGVTDDGADVRVVDRRLIVQSTAFDTADFAWQGVGDVGGPSYAIFRYEHRPAQLAEGGAVNAVGGELQMLFKGSSPWIYFGQDRSYFLSALHIKPAGALPQAFEVNETGTAAPKFRVTPAGDLTLIHGLQYSWPAAAPPAGVKWLQYDPATFALTWITPPAAALPGVGGSGTGNFIPRWVDSANPGTLRDSGLSDDGNVVQANRNFFVFQNPSADEMDVLWRGSPGAASQGLWRYEHNAGIPNGDPANTGGEFQLYLNSSTPALGLGATHSWFYGALWVRPLAAGPFSLEVRAPSDASAVLRVENDGNLALLRKIPYQWPTAQPPAGIKWLQIDPANSNQLAWAALPAGTVIGPGAVGSLAIFTGSGTTIGTSQVTDTGAEIQVAARAFRVIEGGPNDLADVFWQTFTGHQSFWRYEHRSAQVTDAANSGGEMQLFLDYSGGGFSAAFGAASTYFGTALRQRQPSATPAAYTVYQAGVGASPPAVFRVDGDGNLGVLRSQSYTWPSGIPAPAPPTNMKVLGYTSATSPVQLQWLELPTPGGTGTVGPGPINVLPRYVIETLKANSTTLGPSGVSDDGNLIQSLANVVSFQRLSGDYMDVLWRGVSGQASQGLIRYEHSTNIPNGDPANTAGEFQLYLNSSNASALFGPIRSWFLAGLRVRPPAGYPGASNSFEVQALGASTPVFGVAPDGNLAVLRQIAYGWPQTTPAPTATTRVLGYTSNASPVQLAWVDLPTPGGGGNVSNSGAQTPSTLTKWVDATHITNSGISDDGSAITALISDRLTLQHRTSDWADMFFRTSGGTNYAQWRYMHASASLFGPGNSASGAGEMHLFLQNQPSTPTFFVGAAQSWFQTALRVRPFSGYSQDTFAFECWAPGANTANFRVDVNGHIAMIAGLGGYQWPGGHGTSGQVLTNNGSGGLSWTNKATGGGITGSGSLVNALTKWSTPGSVIADSGITDDGNQVIALGNLTAFRSRANDYVDVYLQGSTFNQGIWRYLHTPLGNLQAANQSAGWGEMQLFFQAQTVPTFLVGNAQSWFQTALRLRPPSNYSADAYTFEAQAPSTGAPNFRIKIDGDLSMIRGQSYSWPNAAGTVGLFLQYQAGGQLGWAAASGSGGANTDLSNLVSPTNINQSLSFLPGASNANDGAFNIGTPSVRVGAIYIKNFLGLYPGGSASGPNACGFVDPAAGQYSRFLICGNQSVMQGGAGARTTFTAYHAIEFRPNRHITSAPTVDTTGGDTFGVYIYQDSVDCTQLQLDSSFLLSSNLVNVRNAGADRFRVSSLGSTWSDGGMAHKVFLWQPPNFGQAFTITLSADWYTIIADTFNGTVMNIQLPAAVNLSGGVWHVILNRRLGGTNIVNFNITQSGNQINATSPITTTLQLDGNVSGRRDVFLTADGTTGTWWISAFSI